MKNAIRICTLNTQKYLERSDKNKETTRRKWMHYENEWHTACAHDQANTINQSREQITWKNMEFREVTTGKSKKKNCNFSSVRIWLIIKIWILNRIRIFFFGNIIVQKNMFELKQMKNK